MLKIKSEPSDKVEFEPPVDFVGREDGEEEVCFEAIKVEIPPIVKKENNDSMPDCFVYLTRLEDSTKSYNGDGNEQKAFF